MLKIYREKNIFYVKNSGIHKFSGNTCKYIPGDQKRRLERLYLDILSKN